MDRRRLISYLLLNAFISACVTGTILFWYDRNLKATSPALPPPADVQSGEAVAGADLAPGTPENIEIVSIIGADNLSAETVFLRYRGEGQLDLSNWQLKDESGNIFLFPAITLFPNGAVQVHSTSGANTPIDLYWGLPTPVWKLGETASLYDADGKLIVTYQVP